MLTRESMPSPPIVTDACKKCHADDKLANHTSVIEEIEVAIEAGTVAAKQRQQLADQLRCIESCPAEEELDLPKLAAEYQEVHRPPRP